MADTPRTYAEILALLPDNTTNLISAQDIRDFVETTRGYGSLSASTVSQAGVAAATPTKATFWETAGESVNMTVQLGSNQIVIPYAGVYKIDLFISFSDGANVKWDVDIRKNGSAIDGARIERKLGAGGDVGSGACGAPPATYAANDTIDIVLTADSGPSTFTVESATLSIFRVG